MFLFAGGGTGGHLYPAIAIAQKIAESLPAAEIHFVGTAKGLECKVIPTLGYSLHLIAVRGFARRWTVANVLVPFRLMWSLLQCVGILIQTKPSAVIGTGGYVSGPMLMLAALFGYPTLVQEQNSYPGVTTRMLARWVDRVHLSFQESVRFFKKKEKLIVSGNPVRDLRLGVSKQEARMQFGLHPDKPTMLVFGGSQGALAVNKAVIGCLGDLMEHTDLQLIWSTGTTSLQEVRQATEKYAARIWVADFISNMAFAYAASDFAVCRAGALTLAEITLYGLPAILIPLPHAAANHQVINANALEKLGAAMVLREEELRESLLAESIKSLLMNTAKRQAMSTAARAAAFPNATNEIVQSIFSLIQGTKE